MTDALRKAIAAAEDDPHGGKIYLSLDDATTLRAELATSQAREKALRDYGVEMTKALTGVTVGGSEFFKGEKRLGFFEANIAACVKNVEWRLNAARKYGEARGRAALKGDDNG